MNRAAMESYPGALQPPEPNPIAKCLFFFAT
jgi:hypothetical protein